MITFDLVCGAGHGFEGWFRSGEEYDRQRQLGLLTCPVCGAVDVEKRLSAVAVHVARRTASAPAPAPTGGGREEPPRPQAFFKALAEFVEKNFEDVGARFADEARKIDRGETDARNIRGTTTPSEEERLREEGVEFLTVPLPKFDA